MKELKVGIAGLGRLGRVHAQNLAYQIPGVKLSAACSIVEEELTFAKKELGVSEVYTDFDRMIASDLDAVAIVTTSGMHAKQIESALAHGKHVFCEKPLGVTLEECREAEKAVEAHPDLVFFLGFMRRYDPSYAYAKKKIAEGAIGKPYLVKATGIDPESAVEGAIRFAPTSGGLFIDMASHDADLMRWFLGAEAKEVYALGSTFKHPEFAACGDSESGIALFSFDNGAMGMLHVGRTAPYGYHIETEIVGTEGTIRVSPVPEKNLAMLYNKDGVVQECVSGFPERFDEAYRLEMQEFIDCVREGRKPEVTVYDGTRATEMTFATTSAFKNHRIEKIGKDET